MKFATQKYSTKRSCLFNYNLPLSFRNKTVYKELLVIHRVRIPYYCLIICISIAHTKHKKKPIRKNKLPQQEGGGEGGGGGGGGRCLQGNRWFSPPASMRSRLASVIFKMAGEVFIGKTDKNFEFITEILF